MRCVLHPTYLQALGAKHASNPELKSATVFDVRLLIQAYLEWGMHDTAKGVMDNYYTFYVRTRARVMYAFFMLQYVVVSPRVFLCYDMRLFQPPGSKVGSSCHSNSILFFECCSITYVK